MLSSDASGRDDLFCNIMDLTKDSDASVQLSRHMSDTNADASNTNAGSVFSTSKSQPPSSSFDIQSVIKGAKDQGLMDPVEVFKYLQNQIVTGRALEVTSSGLEKTPVRSSGTSRFSFRASNFHSFLAQRARTQASRSLTKFLITILRRKGINKL